MTTRVQARTMTGKVEHKLGGWTRGDDLLQLPAFEASAALLIGHTLVWTLKLRCAMRIFVAKTCLLQFGRLNGGDTVQFLQAVLCLTPSFIYSRYAHCALPNNNRCSKVRKDERHKNKRHSKLGEEPGKNIIVLLCSCRITLSIKEYWAYLAPSSYSPC